MAAAVGGQIDTSSQQQEQQQQEQRSGYHSSASGDATCQPSCPAPVCPAPRCPTPVCPEPQCPALTCPPAPRIPPCPGLSCPEPVCPEPRCPSATPPALSCPQPVCPQPVCPSQPACPARSSGAVAACGSCLWRVLVTYDHFQGFGFYKAYKKFVTWHQANDTCTADGGHLGIINSEKEAEIFRLLYQKEGLSGWVFVGFHDLYREGGYTTVLGQALSDTGFMKWSPGQPDNAGNEDCGSIEHRALLNDGQCEWKVPFICEVPENKALRTL